MIASGALRSRPSLTPFTVVDDQLAAAMAAGDSIGITSETAADDQLGVVR
jgi:hypothetical protein